MTMLRPGWVAFCWCFLAVGARLQAEEAEGGGGVAKSVGFELQPVVIIEEDVYSFEPADNGAGPLWCHGSTCIVRTGDRVFASGIETLKEAQPLNNSRWLLYERGSEGWTLLMKDEIGRTREPSPMVGFKTGELFLSANPTCAAPDARGGPARPEILQFRSSDIRAGFETLLPEWAGTPEFTEHSYRSFAADGERGELILFQNVGYTHAEWAFRNRKGKWSAQGQLKWPWGSDYEDPQPIRLCYPNVALKDRAVHFCGVSDIVEPKSAWRAAKKEITGTEWDYEFRRLFYTWTPDIRSGQFKDWVEIASREDTCGWISPGDLWVAPNGDVHIVWTERAIDERLRDKFFPEAKQSNALNYTVLHKGQVGPKTALLLAEEGGAQEIPGRCRFQVAGGRLFAFTYVSGKDASGQPVSENRVMELRNGEAAGPWVKAPLKQPFTDFFTATVRAGSPESNVLEILGHRVGGDKTISYAKIRLEAGGNGSSCIPSPQRGGG